MAIIDAERAKTLIGAPFRPQGRDRAVGMDCVGVVVAACGLPSDEVRDDYRLRGAHWRGLKAALSNRFRPVSRRQARPGDVLVMMVAHDQWHLGIRTERGFVHADARLRKVVETPGDAPWPTKHFRRRLRSNKRG